MVFREDPRNATGGFWAWRVYKSDTQQIWNDLVLPSFSIPIFLSFFLMPVAFAPFSSLFCFLGPLPFPPCLFPVFLLSYSISFCAYGYSLSSHSFSLLGSSRDRRSVSTLPSRRRRSQWNNRFHSVIYSSFKCLFFLRISNTRPNGIKRRSFPSFVFSLSFLFIFLYTN